MDLDKVLDDLEAEGKPFTIINIKICLICKYIIKEYIFLVSQYE